MTPEQERLVLAHRNLVGAALNALGGMRRYWDRDALIGAGNVALVKAAGRYDSALGVPFRAYAFPRIRGAIIDEARYGSFGGRRVHDEAIAEGRARADLQQELGRQPAAADVAGRLGWPTTQVTDADAAARYATLWSLDFILQEPGLDVLGVEPQDTTAGPEAVAVAAETAREIRAAIAALRPRHRAIVTAYYLHGRGQDDIAAEHGVTGSRICQILAAARNRMRAGLTAAA
jgi:RNA polymerase sigma factor for flagellar operon FliA